MGELTGTVLKTWLQHGVFVDVGAEKEAFLELGEYRDGFTGTNDFKKGDPVSARVLDLHEGKLFLTRRTGDLTRRPRGTSPKPDTKNLPQISPDAWLDGEVEGVTIWGMFVIVTLTEGGDPVVGAVHKSEFPEGFEDKATETMRGGKVRVRVLKYDHEKKRVVMSLKDP